MRWNHYLELLTLNNINEINYYIEIIIQHNLSYRELHQKIKSKEYERLDDNTKNKLILEDITSFMKELGNDFAFIDSEYKIRIGNTYNYIDILLFNIKYNCYTVIELKVVELKKRTYWPDYVVYELY